ncbi:protein translocase subunit SecF [Candidatus Woesearchaeota archaeon]|nr:protein translocase subunit SecF [Candidatus Woesearchaeota archaeon]
MEQFYNKNYKKLMFIPIIIFSLSILVILNNYNQTGDIVNKDVSLKGGLSIEIYTEKEIISLDSVKKSLENEFPKGNFLVRKTAELSETSQNGLVIESSDIKEQEIKPFLERNLDLELKDDENYFVRETSSSLGQSFYRQMLITIIIAFLFMAVTVFIIYRKFIPSIAIIMAPILNMVNTIAVINLLGFVVSEATIAALLLMIGYSVDTDILLTTKVLKKHEGTVFHRMKESFKTGITMTFATITALILATLVSKSLVLKEMFIVLIIGLLFDVISTYLMNTALLKIYLKNEN